ncbi:MAG: T9SS type A sorting domain-containing protein, partial [bacterium]
PPYQETLQIEPNSTQTFTFTFQGTQSFYIEGYLQDIGIREYVIVKTSYFDNIQEEEGLTTVLLSSFPNPAKQGCYIPFKLAKDSNVSLEIYNILGQRVRTIEIGQKSKGSYTNKDRAIFFDLKNDSGQNLSKGLYFYKIKADGFSAIKSMVVK